jgi:protein import protein ZIM17
MRRRCLSAALAARQQRCLPRIAATTTATGATEPLPFWLESGVAIVGREKASAGNHLLSFRARFLGSDARGFAAKSLKDATSETDKAPREEGKAENATESAESSTSASSSSTSPSPGPRTAVAELAAVFTCNVCDLRSAKGFSRVAFERGVVIVTCEGCESMHVLADRLGWFGSAGDAADFLRERDGGGEVRSRAVLLSKKKEPAAPGDSRRAGVLELMPEDLEGWSSSRKKGGGGG